MNLLDISVDCVFELLELQGETRVVGRGMGAELGDAGTVKRAWARVKNRAARRPNGVTR